MERGFRLFRDHFEKKETTFQKKKRERKVKKGKRPNKETFRKEHSEGRKKVLRRKGEEDRFVFQRIRRMETRNGIFELRQGLPF